jgi:hypothetical protein
MQVGRGIDSGAYAHEHFKRDDPEDIRVHNSYFNNLKFYYICSYAHALQVVTAYMYDASTM